MRRFLPFAILLIVGACEDAVAPPPYEELPDLVRPTADAAVNAIFAAVRADMPISLPANAAHRIAIPEHHLTDRSAHVRIYAGGEYVVYRYERGPWGWLRGALLESGTRDGGTKGQLSSISSRQSAMGYDQSIAKLYKQSTAVRDNDWLISNLTSEDRGWNQYSEEYQTDLPFHAEFVGGTQESNDTTFQVQFNGLAEWKGERLTNPEAGDSTKCQASVCDISFQYTDTAGLQQLVGSQRVTLKYYLYVVTPVGVTISGEDIITIARQHTWTASASGGDGSGSFTYAWEERESGGTFSPVGVNSSQYSRSVSVAEAGTTYELRVTASSGGKQASDTFTYVVASNIEPPLGVTINGTAEIHDSGNYQWTSTVTGPPGPYSYQWEHCQGSCSVVGTGSSYQRWVQLGGGDFTLRLTVNASGGQQQSQVDTHWVWVDWPDCPDCM